MPGVGQERTLAVRYAHDAGGAPRVVGGVVAGQTAVTARNVAAFVLAGGEGARLGALTERRAKPVLPIGLSHRLVDFTLANCVRSGLQHAAVLVQYLPHSIEEHVGRDARGASDSSALKLSVCHPNGDGHGCYAGTADAVYRNLGVGDALEADAVLVLAGDHVYTMDYGEMLEFHRMTDADVTVGVTRVPLAEASRFGIVRLNAEHRVSRFDEKPARPAGNLASMGVYVFNAARLAELLMRDAADLSSGHDFGFDVIPAALTAGLRVHAYEFRGYWRDVGTIEAYWSTNMDTLARSLDDRPRGAGHTGDSLVHERSVVRGRVERSLVAEGVIVQAGAAVTDSVLLSGARIESGAVLDRVIVDEHAVVGAGACVGTGPVERPNVSLPHSLWSGISVIGMDARIPAGLGVSRNVIVGPDVADELAGLRGVPPGATVVAAPHRRSGSRRRPVALAHTS